MKRLLVFTALVPLAVLGLVTWGSAAPAGSTDLSIAKTDSPDPARVGATLTYTLTVANLGPLPATGVTVTDTLPREVDLVAASASAGTCAAKGRKVTCALGTVGSGVQYGAPPEVTIAVTPRAAGTISNTAAVKGDQRDPVGRNNRATARTRVFAAVSCRGLTATVTGTPGNDVLSGTGGPDVIAALGGDDTVYARAGRDLVCAGAGNDLVNAGTAADRVFGGAGRDRLLGRGGPDVLKGQAGADVLEGNRGSDRLRGGRGFDRCRGGAGSDSVRGCER